MSERSHSEVSSEGGVARAKRLTREQRRKIASQAAQERWHGDLPRATHGSPDQPLRIGDIEIPCYVIEGGTRVITNRGLQRSLGMAESGGAQRLGNMVAVLESKGIDCKHLTARIARPIEFRPAGAGRVAFGYEATVLADLCDVILAARKAGLLQRQQEHIADFAETLVRGFARVGIIALVDEATGYQDARARDALAVILEEYIAKELRKWVRTFPPDFYKEMFRLRGLPYTGQVKKPAYIGHLTNDLVYARLAPGVLNALQSKNPVLDNGHRKNKHHQWHTEDSGHPSLLRHLDSVVSLMRAADDWGQFKNMLDRAKPKQIEMPPSLFDAE
jgi:hypothetical protein